MSDINYRDLRKAIDRFREESGGKRPKFPPEIRSRAVEVVAAVGIRRAVELLGISESALTCWRRKVCRAKKTPKIELIELDTPRTSTESAEVITVTSPAGYAIALGPNITPTFVAELLTRLTCSH